MPSIERTIVVPGRRHDVFAYLADFTNTVEWDPPTRSTERISGDGGTGTRYRNVSRVLGNDMEILYTVVAHQPPRRFELVGATSYMRVHDTMVVEQEGALTHVKYRAKLDPIGVMWLATPLLPAALRILGDTAAKQMEQALLSRRAA